MLSLLLLFILLYTLLLYCLLFLSHVHTFPSLSPPLPLLHHPGVPPGTVVITNKAVNAFLKEEHETVGQSI